MRKVVLLSVLMALFSISAFSQLKFGVKGGVNISSVHFSEEILNSDNITGFHIGPMMEFMVPVAGLGVDAAVLYSQKGLSTAGETMKTDYIEIPVNLKWKCGIPIIKFYAAAGPYIGFKVGGKSLWDIPGSMISEFKAKNFSAGLNFSAGVEVLSHLQVGLTYGLGLTDNYSVTRISISEDIGKNRGWLVSAAILF